MEVQPTRVQLSRRRGWRMPPNTTKIDRSTKWGNPFKVGQLAAHPRTGKPILVESKMVAIQLYEMFLQTPVGSDISAAARQELRGKNLACWCKSGQLCHGDVLLAVVNRSTARVA